MRCALVGLAACLAGCAPSLFESPGPLALGAGERAVIERAVRETLGLNDDDPVDAATFARVAELDLSGELITDAGAAWLSDPATGFGELATRYLDGTQVTDDGLAYLARGDTGLRSLENLYLIRTGVTDAGLEDLARDGTGLGQLSKLNLHSTAVTPLIPFAQRANGFDRPSVPNANENAPARAGASFVRRLGWATTCGDRARRRPGAAVSAEAPGSLP